MNFSAGAEHFQPNPQRAVPRARPEPQVSEAELGQRDTAFAEPEDSGRRLRPKRERVRERRGQREALERPRCAEQREGRKHDAVQRDPPGPQDERRLRREVDGSSGLAR